MNVLAIDFGDGTTTAALYNEGCNAPEVLSAMPGIKEIPSILGYPTEVGGDYAIGGQALNPKYISRMHWKKRPTDNSKETLNGYSQEEREKDAINYMKRYYELLLTQNPSLNKNDYITCIGVPSGWSTDDMEKYQEFAQKAGIPNVKILRESQAATLFARKFMTDNKGERLSDDVLNNGLLLIDIGSSTTDLTYIKGLDAQHWGVPLGAKYIDRLFLKYAAERANYSYPVPRDDNERISLNTQKMEHSFKCRKIKEDHFSNCSQDSKTTYPDVFIRVGAQGGTNCKLMVIDDEECITDKLICQILDSESNYYFTLPGYANSPENASNSWRGHFRQALSNAQKMRGFDQSKLSIVITGGASRMYFIEDDIRKEFGEEIPLFFGSDDQRSFSVVMGLAWAGYANETINAHREKISLLLKEQIEMYLKNDIISKVVTPYAQHIASKSITELQAKLCQGDETVNTLNKIEKEWSLIVKKHLSAKLKNEEHKIIYENLNKIIEKYKVDEGVQAINSHLRKEFGSANIKLVSHSIKIEKIGIPDNVNINMSAYCFSDFISETIAYMLFSVLYIIIGKPDSKDFILEKDRMIRLANGKIANSKVNLADKIKVVLSEKSQFSQYMFDFVFIMIKQNLMNELDAIAGAYSTHSEKEQNSEKAL